jgi:hypothetical protein
LAQELVKQRATKKSKSAVASTATDSAFLKGFALRFEGEVHSLPEGPDRIEQRVGVLGF